MPLKSRQYRIERDCASLSASPLDMRSDGSFCASGARAMRAQSGQHPLMIESADEFVALRKSSNPDE